MNQESSKQEINDLSMNLQTLKKNIIQIILIATIWNIQLLKIIGKLLWKWSINVLGDKQTSLLDVIDQIQDPKLKIRIIGTCISATKEEEKTNLEFIWSL